VPLTAEATMAFLSDLSAIPRVFLAAAEKAAFTAGLPAPGARLERVKSVTCFLAATAMIIVAFLPFPPIASWMGLKRCHLAGIAFHRDNYLTKD